MKKPTVISAITILLVATVAAGAIFLVKGYKFSPTTGTVSGTGIISITSTPDGASVFIDGHLTSATNTTISSLVPKNYDIKIVKDGFISWQKNVQVKQGLVSELKLTLFPAIPTIYPLTFDGVYNPLLSPDDTKLAFASPLSTQSGTLRQKGGVWVFTMETAQPISFNRSSGLRQIIPATVDLDFTQAQMRFSPDSKQLLVTLQEGGKVGPAFERNYLLPTDQTLSLVDLKDITPTVQATLSSWDQDQKTKDQARIATIADLDTRKVASESATLKWSPDETKFIYRPKLSTLVKEKEGDDLPGFKVYDISEKKQYDLPVSKAYYWLPDSRHVVLVQDHKIGIADFDGSNLALIYGGNFIDSAVYPWPDSSKLMILSSIPTPTASQPNLFGINLK